MSNVNMIIRIYVYMHILTVEPSRARGLKLDVDKPTFERHEASSPHGLVG